MLAPDASLTMRIGLGVLVGGSALALLTLALASMRASSYFAPLVLLGMAFVLRCRFSFKIREIRSAEVTLNERMIALRSIGVGIIGINGTSLPLVAVGILSLLMPQMGLLHFKSQEIRRRATFALVVLGVAVFSAFSWLQPRWMDSSNNDAPFFEALSVLLARFGLAAHPGHIDSGIWGYHVLAYAWSGTLTNLSGAPPFVILNFVVPFLAATSLAMLLLSNTKRQQKESGIQLSLVAAFVWILGNGSFASAAFGTWALIASGVAHIHYYDQPPQAAKRESIVKRELLFGILGIIAVLGKGTALPIVCLIGIAPMVLHFARNRLRDVPALICNFPVHLFAVLFVTYIWFSPTTRPHTSSLQSPIRGVLALGPSEGLWAVRDLLEFGPILGLLGFVAVLLWFKHFGNDHVAYPLTIISLLCLGSLSSVWFFSERPVRSNVTQHAFFVCLGLLVMLASRQSRHAYAHLKLLRLLLSAAAVAVGLSIYDRFFLNELLWSRQWPSRWIAPVLENLRTPLLFVTIFIVVFVGSRLKLFQTNHKTRASYSAPLISLSLFIAIVWISTVVNRIESMKFFSNSHELEQRSPWNTATPDAKTREVGEWIRANTQTSVVLASNSFCCWDNPKFLERALDEFREFEELWTRYEESTWGGSNYLLPAVTHRRFLLAGPRFVVGVLDDPAELTKYFTLSVQFGVTGDSSLATSLREAGVNYFIFDKRVSDPPTLGFDISIEFENSQYIIVKL